MSKIEFIIRILNDRLNYGGYVYLSHVETMGTKEFTEYVKKHGCTLTKKQHGSAAPWSDFEAWIRDKSPLD